MPAKTPRLEQETPRVHEVWYEFFVTAAKGTELVLKEELVELGFRKVRADRGGVRFVGSVFDGARACIESRIAVRVLMPVTNFECDSDTALYDGIRAAEWEAFLDPEKTLSVSAIARDSMLMHTNFIGQKTKDAIVDRLRDRFGSRPSVDRTSADLEVFVHLKKNVAKVYADIGGRSLHQRGYRESMVAAPMKENLAAALLRLSGWDRKSKLIDPLCGSGTLAIEADLWAREVAPGLLHKERLGCERWANHETLAPRLRELRANLQRLKRTEGPVILGSDVDSLAIEAARANGRRAGTRAQFSVADAMTRTSFDPGSWVVANPPYGERLDLPRELEQQLERWLDTNLQTTFAFFIPELPRGWPRPGAEYAIHNGALECALRLWRAK